jgi:hypothetical protein
MKTTADEARTLASNFRNISVALGDYRFSNWDNITPAQRRSIEDAEWTLLTLSSDMTTRAVGLELSAAEGSFEQIIKLAEEAAKCVQRIKNTKLVLELSSQALVLAGAISTGEPTAIAKATAAVGKSVKCMLDARKEAKLA